jgi:GDP/GTP exchange factor required for growth at low temperature
VRRLVKVAKECKRAHTRAIEKPKACPQPKVVSDPQEGPEGHLLGKSFAEAIKIKKAAEEEDSDLDLDFLPDDTNFEDFLSGFPTDPANAHLTVNNAIKGTAISPSRPTSMPLNILQRTDASGPHAEGEMSFVQNPGQVVLPIRHNSLSRAFMKTIGRIGRWKRVLNPKYSTQPSSLAACGVASAFDLEISAARDMLTTHGGVEEYLMMAGPASSGRSAQQTAPLSQPQVQVPSAPVLPPIPTMPSPVLNTPPVSSDHVHPVSPSNPPNPSSVAPEVTLSLALEKSSSVSAETTATFDALDTLGQSEQDDDTSLNIRDSLNSLYDHDGHDVLAVPERAESFRSSSTDSFGEPLTSAGPLQPTFPGTHSQWQLQFDVVSIDDLDLSDTSSIPGGEDLHDEPAGLRKPLKKLPLRRDFEFVRRSEVSSMGIVSHDSLRDSVSSTHSETSPSSSPERGPIRRWQMKTLQQTFDSSSNDSGDKGDVEDALRRLEGQINPKVLQEKAKKVDGWVRTMQQRMANGDYDDDRSIFSEGEVENFIDELDPFASDPDIQQPEAAVPPVEDNLSDYSDDALLSANTVVPDQMHNLSPAAETEESSLHSKAPISAAVYAVPSAVLRGRLPSADTVSKKFVPPSIETVLSSKFSTSKAPRIHQSFVHDYSAEVLAQHFAMIDRELFIGVKFEELVSEHWMECEGIDILDWSQFLKDRTRWKAELCFPEKTTALAALWARFNLMVNFVVSEIVLTPPSGRPALVNKFIRIAWVSSSFFLSSMKHSLVNLLQRSYCLSNFNSLTAIIVALQNDWVVRAMRRPGWNRISTKEARMYRDLKQFTANIDDFKFMRQVVDSIVDVEPLDTNSHPTSVVSDSQSGKSRTGSENRAGMPSACIPFIGAIYRSPFNLVFFRSLLFQGIYLTQLHRLNKLPAVIDPTAPHQLSALDTVNSVFQSPLHPEVFSSLAPLPPSMSLEVLINVHKQRRIAGVIKSLVAGQHLASRVYFNVDNKKLFQRCLRLRGLDDTYLYRALAMYPD